MNRIIHMVAFLMLSGICGTILGQNLVQNPGFESADGWDHLWLISTTDPSSSSALAEAVTTDVHEGGRSVKLSNSVKLKWTYLYSDSVNAPIALRAGKKYEVRGWLKILEQGKETDLSIFWNGDKETFSIYSGNPDPVSQPDWFMVKDTIYPEVNCADGYVRMGFRTDKEGLFPAGSILLDDFSVERIPEDSDTDILEVEVEQQARPAQIDYMAGVVKLALESGTKVSTVVLQQIEVSPGAKVTPASGDEIDVSDPAYFTVTAKDGVTTQDWIVEVEVLPSTETEILDFTLPGQSGLTGIDSSAHQVDLHVPFGTDLSSLVPTISTSEGATIDPTSGTAIDFTSPVMFTVTAEDLTTKQIWTVTVSETAPSNDADITGFTLSGLDSRMVIDTEQNTVEVQVPNETDVTALEPSIEVSAGATVIPASGTVMDFTSPVIYTVTAEDGLKVEDWTVQVTLLPASATEITAFTLPEQSGPASIDIDAGTIAIEVVAGTDLTALIPEVEVSPGASVTPASGEIIDFSSEVTLTVTGQDGTTKQSWVVTVTIASTATGIPGNPLEKIRLYPNPADNFLVVEMAENATVYLQDLHGRTIYTVTDLNNRTVLPVSQFKRGIYMVIIQSAGGRKVFKVLLE